MKTLINLISARTYLRVATFVLVGGLITACSPSVGSIVDNVAERISDTLALNEEQNTKLDNLKTLVEPVLKEAYEKASKDRKTLRNQLKSGEDLSPDNITALIDNLMPLYQDNQQDISQAMAEFYNSLDADQRKKLSKKILRGHGFMRGRHHRSGHGHGGHDGHDGDHDDERDDDHGDDHGDDHDRY